MPLSDVRRAGRSAWWIRFMVLLAAGAALAGCRHVPVKAWQRANLAKRAMKFDDGLESRFKQHMFSAREGAEGGYGDVGGGCGCN
jgi:hypothetical protein